MSGTANDLASSCRRVASRRCCRSPRPEDTVRKTEGSQSTQQSLEPTESNCLVSIRVCRELGLAWLRFAWLLCQHRHRFDRPLTGLTKLPPLNGRANKTRQLQTQRNRQNAFAPLNFASCMHTYIYPMSNCKGV